MRIPSNHVKSWVRGCVSVVPVLGSRSLEFTDKQSSQSVSSSPVSDLISESKAESS